MAPLFPLLAFISIILSSQSNSNLATADATEQQALLSIKSKLSDPFSILASWRNDSLDICQWRGINCTNTYPRHVTALNLASSGLSGSISSAIVELTFIKSIDLQNNSLREIPVELDRMNNLEHLDLSYNHLYGLVPNSLYNISSLIYLNLYYNNLTGAIPPNLGHRLPKLQILDLGGNNFQGDIGDILTSLTNCSALQTLYLTGNKLSGSLPNTMGNLSVKLQKLLISYNEVSGTIPREIGNLASLTDLDLTTNTIEGVLPTTISSLSSLVRMQISYNRLSGPIPYSIGNLTKLETLSLIQNALNGTIPTSLGNLTNLQNLQICSNQLEGIIPIELFGPDSSMIMFDASNNSLVGPVPSVPIMSQLSSLFLRWNKFNGTIPSSLGSCQSLEFINLRGNNIQGNIPESFAESRAIRDLILSQNHLSGIIPDFLTSIRSLKYLDLSYNNFVGELPTGGIFNDTSAVILVGNQGLCGGGSQFQLSPCPDYVPKNSTGPSKMVLIISVTGTIAVLICFCLLVCFLCQLRRKKKLAKVHIPVPFKHDMYKKVSYADIMKATDGFSSINLVGSGSFGSVYKGTLDNQLVAVKVFDLEQHGALKSFNLECESLKNIRHRSLIDIVTLCSSIDFKGNEFKSLVLHYIPNGSLEEWIHQKSPGMKLSLTDGIKIAADVAAALGYLHHECATPMVHCDIKPSNILIDTDMTALVSDFGLARFLASSHVTSGVSSSLLGLKGTIGYIAPEYALGATISREGDVYSYGILLLEMLTGKRPTDDIFKDGFNIHAYVSNAFPDRIIDILAPNMSGELEFEENSMENQNMVMNKCIIPLVQVGLACSKEAPKDRMTMNDVTAELSKIKEIFT